MFDSVKAVIFDVDGTLVDSMWIWRQVDIEYLGKREIELPETLQKEIEGKSYTETAIYFKERFNLPDSVEEIKEEWRMMAEDFYKNRIALKKGAKELIQSLYRRGVKLGIATSNSRELVEHMLDNHGIRRYFYRIKTSCEVDKGKPYPDVYLKVAEELEVQPEECLVFEDTVAGVTAAISAGMRVVAIADEVSKDSKEKLVAMTEGYIQGFDEVMEFLQ